MLRQRTGTERSDADLEALIVKKAAAGGVAPHNGRERDLNSHVGEAQQSEVGVRRTVRTRSAPLAKRLTQYASASMEPFLK